MASETKTLDKKGATQASAPTALEKRQPRLVHVCDAFFRITAQDQIQFFRTPVMRAINRALASDFKPVH